MRIGVLSDTHGLLRPEAMTALRGVEHILHLGDVGRREILDALRAIAPVTAIRGNVDTAAEFALLPAKEVVELAGKTFYLLHNPADLDLDPRAAGFDAVLHGHTHTARNEMVRGVLYFNPGSAGPRRFSLPVTIGFLTVDAGNVRGEILPILD